MRHSLLYFFVPVFFLTFLAYFIQTQFFIEGDVGYLVHTANQVLAGGKYIKDIFETNPPLIFYLYSPIKVLTTWGITDIVFATRLYVLGLALLSLISSFILLNKIFLEKKIITYFVSYFLTFCFLFLTLDQFGQREHLMFMLIFPYLLSTTLALEKRPVKPLFAFIIGLMAGLGLALKPYFLGLPIFVELFFMIRTRSLWSGFRIESVTIFSVFVTYLVLLWHFHPSYIQTMLPLIKQFYYEGIKEPWPSIFGRDTVCFCCIGLFGALVLYQFHSNFSALLTLGLISMIMAFMIPQAPWYYHVYPALSFTFLLSSYLVSRVIYHFFLEKKVSLGVADISFASAFAILVFFFPCYIWLKTLTVYMGHIKKHSMHDVIRYVDALPKKQSIFCFFGTRSCFPLIFETHSEFASRFPSLWWLPGLTKLHPPFSPEVVASKNLLVENVADDLNRRKAKLVIINAQFIQLIWGYHFNVLNYLSTDPKFKEAWKHYHYLTTIGDYRLYQRNTESVHG